MSLHVELCTVPLWDDTVSVPQLVECPMSLVDLPAQAIQCSMTGVSADCGEQLAAKIDQMVRTIIWPSTAAVLTPLS